MASRVTPLPTSVAPETGDIDDTWEDLVLGALSAPPVRRDGGIFDRATAVPNSPPDGSGLELADSDAPPPTKKSDPYRDGPAAVSAPSANRAAALLQDTGRYPGLTAANAPTVGPARGAAGDSRGRMPLPGGRGEDRAEALDRKRTATEPVVERYEERVAAGQPTPADALDRRRRDSDLEADLSLPEDSPLELVETYRRASEKAPGPDPEPERHSQPGGRESGTLQDMQDRYAVGDFTGALVVAESILDAEPENEGARKYAQSCREVLTQMYAARIGSMTQIATVAVPPDQITWLSLDHRAGFLLSLVDGVSSIEEILDVSGMTRLDALRIMYTLVQQNVIVLRA